MNQVERVVRLARSRGAQGITQVDFLTPTADGGPAITRLAARVYDAKGQGFEFCKAGTRNSCDIYCLVEMSTLFDAERFAA